MRRCGAKMMTFQQTRALYIYIRIPIYLCMPTHHALCTTDTYTSMYYGMISGKTSCSQAPAVDLVYKAIGGNGKWWRQERLILIGKIIILLSGGVRVIRHRIRVNRVFFSIPRKIADLTRYMAGAPKYRCTGVPDHFLLRKKMISHLPACPAQGLVWCYCVISLGMFAALLFR